MAEETHKVYTYKEQGDGSDSWRVDEYEDNTEEVLLESYMVYEDPTKIKKVNLKDIDVDSITDEDIDKLKIRLGI